MAALAAAALFAACSEDPAGPASRGESYWPAADRTSWLMRGRWQDLSGGNAGGEFGIETTVAGTSYDGEGRPVKKWLASEVDGYYYVRVAGGEVWANWTETNPKANYHLWLKLPPEDGQYWEDYRYRVSVHGPFELSVPFGDYGDVYRARYDYVGEPGHYEIWWYAAGVGCIKYEHYLPGEKHEMVELVEFTPGS
ncbi:MAG: hypothetical protein PVH29_04880 [Candidatus Zixiibacteriota bacterium]|jgi:hypothetical protein